MKKLLIILIAVVIVALGVWHFGFGNRQSSSNQYAYVQVQRGNIQSLISSTGTLQAVETVQVGTQVSGTIKQIFVDFNDKVRKGQLLARLDTSVLEVAVSDAEAKVAIANAQLRQANDDLNRNKQLFDKALLPETDYNQSLTNVEVARAQLQSDEVALDRTRINLAYAEIMSPIDGIVIERSVDEGQTVAASLSAPTLFVIAKNLASMQILAQVDESDIGQIRDGQVARFTVPAHPDQTFQGTVQQIRLQPEIVSNVVMYTVVVNAQNDKGVLLPGMTATVDFVVQDVRDVLCVPNSALRFNPPEYLVAQRDENEPSHFSNLPDSLRTRRSRPPASGEAFAARETHNYENVNPAGSRVVLWVANDKGTLDAIPIQTGATNGTTTEIVSGHSIEVGMRVVSGLLSSNDKTSANSSSQRQGGFHGPRLF